MAVLHNRISQAELKKQLLAETLKRITISFYRYFSIDDPNVFRDKLYVNLFPLQVFGRVYIAKEGINAQVSIPEENYLSFQYIIKSIPECEDIYFNEAVDNDGKSFYVLKIKVREKIVADGITDPGFSMHKRGKYVDAKDLNRLVNEANTILVDMRNHYEYEVGHFNDAIEIPSDTFREQLPMAAEMLQDKKESNIIMYCTGGIRCEKASAYMLHQGFKNVYHLQGGIIRYANTVTAQEIENKFEGKNFVFDERLGERITDTVIANCHQCGSAADTHTNCKNEACHLLFIQCETCSVFYEGCCSDECKAVIALSEEKQKILRKQIDKGSMIFNKSKARLRKPIPKRPE
ncbi:MAG: rhodanese-related sulfurtransferase [Ferruginibacter sp.]